jgi:hypothetical protein
MPAILKDVLTWGIDGLHVTNSFKRRAELQGEEREEALDRILHGIMMDVGPRRFREMVNDAVYRLQSIADVPLVEAIKAEHVMRVEDTPPL